MKLVTLVLALLITLTVVEAQQRRPPPGSQQVEVVPLPGTAVESDFFGGATAYYSDSLSLPKTDNRPDNRPIIIGLSFSASSSGLKKVAEEEARRFALTITRNVIAFSPPWEAKEKFKSLASGQGQSQYRWLWLEAEVTSLSLAWFHCFNPVCFAGSQAKVSVKVIEINNNQENNEVVIGAVSGHLIGHIHEWAKRMWLENPGENFYYFTGRMILRLVLNEFKGYLLKNLGR
jgi:hypothetical protein